MRPPLRSILVLTVIVGLSVSLLVLQWGRLASLDLGLVGLPEWYRQYLEEINKEAEIKRKGGLQLLVFPIKNRVTRELLQGQTSLRQAVGIFRYLHETPPFDPTIALPGATPAEKYGRNVLMWARVEQRYFPTRFSFWVVERLEAELQQLLAGPRSWIPEVKGEEIPELRSLSR
jgi:hypothetical protein